MNQTKPSRLLLIPTRFEERIIRPMLELDSSFKIALCGFGPIVAGIRASMLIQQHQPEHVILSGIAGALHQSLSIGSACSFSQVVCYGIGAGTGSQHLSAEEMGWSFFEPDNSEQSPAGGVEGPLSLSQLPLPNEETSTRELLTVCSSSASADDVAQRLVKHPQAIAEDMESYSVAAACRLLNVPVSVVRGISNEAGDRDKENWQVESALGAVAEIVNSIAKADT